MSQLEDIRRAIAANLRVVLPEDVGHVSPYLDEKAKPPTVQVVGVVDYSLESVGGGVTRYEIGVEAMCGLITQKGASKRMDSFIESGAMMAALDSSLNPLTSRLLEDGTVEEDEEDAGVCNYLRFGGPGRLVRGGAEVLVATWFCEVYPPDEVFT